MLLLSSIVCSLLAVNAVSAKIVKDAIGFPEVEENTNLKNKEVHFFLFRYIFY